MFGAVGALLALWGVLFYNSGSYHEAPSAVLGEVRGFDVYLPANYEDCISCTFPVVYSLDGEKARHSSVFAANGRLMAAFGGSSETIFVAIHTHGKRGDDFSPDRRAKEFSNYLAEELKPYIEAHYRVGGVDAISGHSYGGLFVLYLFARRPELFDIYFSYVPSIFHHDEIVMDVKRQLETQRSTGTALLVTSGLESQSMFWSGYNRLLSVLKLYSSGKLHWRSEHFFMPHALSMLPAQLVALSLLKGV